MHSLTTCLWFDNEAEEAANFYANVIKDSEITSVFRNPEASRAEKGTILTVNLTIKGINFMLLNGGPHYKLSPAVSFMLFCDTQEEIDFYWDTFAEGGEEMMCGWITDKFGVSWQLVPTVYNEMIKAPEKGNVNKMFEALLGMKKLDISQLVEAYNS